MVSAGSVNEPPRVSQDPEVAKNGRTSLGLVMVLQARGCQEALKLATRADRMVTGMPAAQRPEEIMWREHRMAE